MCTHTTPKEKKRKSLQNGADWYLIHSFIFISSLSWKDAEVEAMMVDRWEAWLINPLNTPQTFKLGISHLCQTPYDLFHHPKPYKNLAPTKPFPSFNNQCCLWIQSPTSFPLHDSTIKNNIVSSTFLTFPFTKILIYLTIDSPPSPLGICKAINNEWPSPLRTKN